MQKLFHGSPYKVAVLKSSAETGNIRSGEEGRQELLNVVFLTTDQHEASKYAGEEGYIYVVDVEKAWRLSDLPVRHTRSKKDSSTTIWVAYPEDIQVIRVICPDGRVKKPFRERILLG